MLVVGARASVRGHLAVELSFTCDPSVMEAQQKQAEAPGPKSAPKINLQCGPSSRSALLLWRYMKSAAHPPCPRSHFFRQLRRQLQPPLLLPTSFDLRHSSMSHLSYPSLSPTTILPDTCQDTRCMTSHQYRIITPHQPTITTTTST